MQEIRCKGCDSLLGEFEGCGLIRCRKANCGGVNEFNTKTGEHKFIPKNHVYLNDRKTSSGVTFR